MGIGLLQALNSDPYRFFRGLVPKEAKSRSRVITRDRRPRAKPRVSGAKPRGDYHPLCCALSLSGSGNRLSAPALLPMDPSALRKVEKILARGLRRSRGEIWTTARQKAEGFLPSHCSLSHRSWNTHLFPIRTKRKTHIQKTGPMCRSFLAMITPSPSSSPAAPVMPCSRAAPRRCLSIFSRCRRKNSALPG